MSTQYSHRVTLAVPASLITRANHLACIMGETSADIGTFNKPTWQDAAGKQYAIASTVVKPVFLGASTGTLPASPPHAEAADRIQAQEALDTLGKAGGILMAVDVEPMKALEGWGLTPIPPKDTEESL